MGLDILHDIQGAMDKAIAQGKTFAWFQGSLKNILASKG